MLRVLIVEDSPTQAQHIQAMLQDAEFHTEVARHGLEALDVLRRSAPDIVVTDLVMPEMNGLELVEAIRRDFSSVPVILMTAHGSEEIAALALRKGAASYVPKALLEQYLISTLEHILAATKVDRFHRRALECLAETESRFILPNDAELIPPIIGHLEEVLIRLNLCHATDRMRIGVALHEALLNAMDHGNLEVSSSLRQDDENAYAELLAKRRRQPPYLSRRVYLGIKVTPAKATYTVRDEGPGFDPSLLPDPTDAANLETVGGRGLLLIRTFMDEVYHNERGNEITLIKRRSG